MKFAKHLALHTKPEWAANYVNYKTLKKLLAQGGPAASRALLAGLQADLTRVNALAALQRQACDAEAVALASDEEGLAHLRGSLGSAGAPASADVAAAAALVASRRAALGRAREDLRAYCEINFTACYKIAKKHDKTLGCGGGRGREDSSGGGGGSSGGGSASGEGSAGSAEAAGQAALSPRQPPHPAPPCPLLRAVMRTAEQQPFMRLGGVQLLRRRRPSEPQGATSPAYTREASGEGGGAGSGGNGGSGGGGGGASSEEALSERSELSAGEEEGSAGTLAAQWERLGLGAGAGAAGAAPGADDELAAFWFGHAALRAVALQRAAAAGGALSPSALLRARSIPSEVFSPRFLHAIDEAEEGEGAGAAQGAQQQDGALLPGAAPSAPQAHVAVAVAAGSAAEEAPEAPLIAPHQQHQLQATLPQFRSTPQRNRSPPAPRTPSTPSATWAAASGVGALRQPSFWGAGSEAAEPPLPPLHTRSAAPAPAPAHLRTLAAFQASLITLNKVTESALQTCAPELSEGGPVSVDRERHLRMRRLHVALLTTFSTFEGQVEAAAAAATATPGGDEEEGLGLSLSPKPPPPPQLSAAAQAALGAAALRAQFELFPIALNTIVEALSLTAPDTAAALQIMLGGYRRLLRGLPAGGALPAEGGGAGSTLLPRALVPEEETGALRLYHTLRASEAPAGVEEDKREPDPAPPLPAAASGEAAPAPAFAPTQAALERLEIPADAFLDAPTASASAEGNAARLLSEIPGSSTSSTSSTSSSAPATSHPPPTTTTLPAMALSALSSLQALLAQLLTPSVDELGQPTDLQSPPRAFPTPLHRAWHHHHPPILDWLPEYRPSKSLAGDCAAGITIGVLLVPQGLVCASLAGMSSVYGLFAGLPPLIYVALGTSHHAAIGPMSIPALMIFSGLQSAYGDSPPPALYARRVATVSFLIGLLLLLMGWCKLGFLLRFVSRPVFQGFTFAAAVLTVLSTASDLLGTRVARAAVLQDHLASIAAALPRAHALSLCLSLGALGATLLLARRIKTAALVVVLAGILGCACAMAASGDSGAGGVTAAGVQLVGAIPSALTALQLQLPLLAPGDLLRCLPCAASVAFVSLIESLAVAKQYGALEGYEVSIGSELKALGTTNLLGSAMLGTLPVMGAFGRSAVNHASGARSACAGAVSVACVGFLLLVAMPVLFYLPRPILAAILVAGVSSLLSLRPFARLWATDKADFAVMCAATLATLCLGVALGVAAATVLSLCVFVGLTTQPRCEEVGRLANSVVYKHLGMLGVSKVPGIKILRFLSPLFFANASVLKDRIQRELLLRAMAPPRLRFRALILCFSAIAQVDSTSIGVLGECAELCHGARVVVLLGSVNAYVEAALRGAGLLRTLAGGEEGREELHLHRRVHDAVRAVLTGRVGLGAGGGAGSGGAGGGGVTRRGGAAAAAAAEEAVEPADVVLPVVTPWYRAYLPMFLR